MSQAPKEVERILLIELGHIGDTLVATPLISALKQNWPGAKIWAVVNQGTQDMLTGNQALERVIPLKRDHDTRMEGIIFQLGLIKYLRSLKFDLALDLSRNDRGAYLARFSGAKFRQGYEPKKNKFRAKVFHSLVNGRGTDQHMVDFFLRHALALGIEPQKDHLVLEPGPKALVEAARLLSRHGLNAGGYALVHPTSRWMFKSWTHQGNAKVIKHLLDQGLSVILTAAPDKREMDFVAGIKRELGEQPQVFDFSGQVDLKLLAALLAGARVFFGVDSAPMHMAAALKVPTVVLFGPSGEAMWGPWRVEHEVVTMSDDELPERCRPCGADGCKGSKVSRCLTELPPERVIDALDRVLARTGAV